MAVTTLRPSIAAPDLRAVLGPLLPCLPAAALSTQPPPAVLPLLSPILRQRVQLLSSADAAADPWLRLLSYDAAAVPQLSRAVQSGPLDAHPVSGEVEVDWDAARSHTRYRRLDRETLQALVLLHDLGLAFRLVYCVGDPHGDGWRLGEVGLPDKPDTSFASFGDAASIDAAERLFEAAAARPKSSTLVNGVQAGGAAATSVAAPNTAGGSLLNDDDNDDEDDDDDDYWARYDATPARTPAVKRSPAPASSLQAAAVPGLTPNRSTSAEDAYFAQYDSVQPAMDNHDPDEEVEHVSAPSSLDAAPTHHSNDDDTVAIPSPSHESSPREIHETSGSWTLTEPPVSSGSPSHTLHHHHQQQQQQQQQDEQHHHHHCPHNDVPDVDPDSDPDPDPDHRARLAHVLQHPRPESSASSNGSQTVARLEETAGKQEQSEFGVKQHVSRSIRSLFQLSRASGIERDEFERLVRTELDMLAMMEDEV